MSEPKRYQPSNGTEFGLFMADHCDLCRHEDRPKRFCRILDLSAVHQVDEPEYPPELTYDADGNPTCTAFEPEGGAS